MVFRILGFGRRHELMRCFIAALLTTCVLGLGPNWAIAATKAEPKTVLVLVDLSDSISQEQRAGFVGQYRFILDTLKPGDTLMFARIMASPSTQIAARDDYVSFVDATLNQNLKAVQRKNMEAAIRNVRKFEQIVQNREPETPILEVLSDAPRRFAQFPAKRRIIVLMSDMRESSKYSVDFESTKTPITEKRAQMYLDGLVSKKLIPNLAGVHVYVTGAGDKSPVVHAIVKGFWQRYFGLAGAEFDTVRYGADMLVFEGCKFGDQKSEDCTKVFRDRLDVNVKLP